MHAKLKIVTRFFLMDLNVRRSLKNKILSLQSIFITDYQNFD